VNKEWGWRISPFDNNSVEFTNNGGKKWSSPIKVENDFEAQSILFVSEKEGWLIGLNSVLKTDNYGQTWQLEKKMSGLNLKHSFLLDKNHIWFASAKGNIAYTLDGGKNWEVVNGVPRNINSLFFSSDSNGWVVGEDGLIAHTSNGGKTWEISNEAKNNRLLDIFFIGKNGWAVGENGLILKTNDNGNSWNCIPTTTKANLSSIYFIDGLKGWAVGGIREPIGPFGKPSNVVIETTDGGDSWKVWANSFH
jgi:photosystem II stability/assembly factor-like uncharacterized protein